MYTTVVFEVCFTRGTEAGVGLMWATRSAPQSFSARDGPDISVKFTNNLFNLNLAQDYIGKCFT